MDPNWASVGILILGMGVTALVAYQAALRGTAVALARGEERERALRTDYSRLQLVQDEHSRTLGDHNGRIRVLENEMDLRPPPADYVR